MKAKVTEGNVDFILSLGYTTGFVKEPELILRLKIDQIAISNRSNHSRNIFLLFWE